MPAAGGEKKLVEVQYLNPGIGQKMESAKQHVQGTEDAKGNNP